MTIKFTVDGFALESGNVTVYMIDGDGFYSHEDVEYVAEGTTVSVQAYVDPPPPIKDGFAIIRREHGWEYVIDNRGTYYNTVTGDEVIITARNADISNLTKLKPPSDTCRWDGEQWVVCPDKLGEKKAVIVQQLIDNIDNHAATIYLHWTRFETEYTQREAAAMAFKTANYQGSASRFITDFAEKAGIDNKIATDLILVQAEGLRRLLVELANQRMRKYELKKDGLTEDEMQAIYDDIIQQMEKLAEAYQNG